MKTTPFYPKLFVSIFAFTFLFQLSFAQTSPDSVTIRGLIQSPPFHASCIGSSNSGMPDVRVSVDDLWSLPPGFHFTKKTGISGHYAITLPIGGNYRLEFEKSNHNWTCGISAVEFVMLREALKDKKPFRNAWEYIAADLNGDGMVSNKDLAFMQKLLIDLNNNEKMPLHTNWVFVYVEDYAAIGSLKPIPGETKITYHSFLNFENVTDDLLVYEFFGVKVGDISGDCDDCSDGEIQKRLLSVNSSAVHLTLPNQSWEAGESLDLCFRVSEKSESVYFQNGIRFDPEFFEIVNVYASNEDKGHFFANTGERGKIKISWSGEDYEEKTFSKNESVFCVKVKALRSGSTFDNLIAFDDDILENVWIKNTNEFSALSLNLAAGDNENVFSKNNPTLITNPLSGTFQLEFETLTGEPEAVILQIMDANGNLLLQQSGNATAGANRFENLNLGQFSGLVSYRITSSSGIITSGKLMVR